jgi:polysaccharide biosynthesis transport protein
MQPAGMPAHGDGLIEQWLGVLRRRKWVILQALVIVPAAALILSLSQSKEYRATASLLFTTSTAGAPIQGSDPGVVDPSRQAATNDQLVGLPAIAQETAIRLHGGVSASDIADSVSVEPGGASDIARITATTSSPSLSAKMANAYGEAFIAFRRKSNQLRLQRAIRVLQQNLAALSPAERAGSGGQAIQEQLDQTRVNVGLQTGNAQLVQPAAVPATASSPKITRNIVLGIVLGAILGLLLAALLERLDRSVRSAEEIEELAGVPVIARIPKSKSLSARGEQSAQPLERAVAAFRARPLDPANRAFRTLRANLHNFNVDDELRSILVVGHEPGGGKSTVARRLALTMGEVRDSVVLVEADLQKDQPPAGQDGASGSLAAVLEGAPLKPALTSVEMSTPPLPGGRIAFLPAGLSPPNASELIGSDEMRAVVHELEDRFDLVIIDSPPLAVASDALALVPSVSGVLIVCAVGRTRPEGVRELSYQLSLVGAHVLGIVANFAAPRVDDYHYRQSRLRSLVNG